MHPMSNCSLFNQFQIITSYHIPEILIEKELKLNQKITSDLSTKVFE